MFESNVVKVTTWESKKSVNLYLFYSESNIYLWYACVETLGLMHSIELSPVHIEYFLNISKTDLVMVHGRYALWFLHERPTVNKFNCSKHGVTMTSSSQATVHTCNDYSDNNVWSFCSRSGRQDTLLLLTRITKVLVECTVEPQRVRS